MLQLKWVWKNMKGKRGYFIIGMLLVVVTSAMQVVTPKLTQIIIDEVWKGGRDSAFFYHYCCRHCRSSTYADGRTFSQELLS